MKNPRDAANLAAELAVLAETLGMGHMHVRSSIYARALSLRLKSDIPLEQLTAELTKGVADYLATFALRGERPSLDEAIEKAAAVVMPGGPNGTA